MMIRGKAERGREQEVQPDNSWIPPNLALLPAVGSGLRDS